MPARRPSRRLTAPRPIRWTRWGAFGAIALAFLEVPALAHVPARLVAGCAGWIAFAGALELLSMVGFIVVFKLVFGVRLSWRQGIAAGLRALGATTVLPAGGLVGPAMGARTGGEERVPLPVLTRRTIAFTILTNAPGFIVLGALGLSLWLGWPTGPHRAGIILPAVGLALALMTAVWLIGRSPSSKPPSPEPRWNHPLARHATAGVRILRDGAAEARRLLTTRDWKLAGALGYYTFDNAVLWAAFHAYGRTPPVSVIVIGYLVGSLGGALPVPAGLGVLEGGLIGALVLYGAPVAPAAAAVLLYRGISLALPVALSACAWTVVAPARPAATPHSMMSHRRWRRRATPKIAGSRGPSTARRSRGVA